MRYKGLPGKCWELVREYVKKRDGDKCFTCPRQGSEWGWDAGHYRPVAIVGKNNKKAWDHRFIRRQCKRCNGMGQGEQVEFRRKLVLELGEEVVAEYDRAVAAKEVDKADFNETHKFYMEMLGRK